VVSIEGILESVTWLDEIGSRTPEVRHLVIAKRAYIKGPGRYNEKWPNRTELNSATRSLEGQPWWSNFLEGGPPSRPLPGGNFREKTSSKAFLNETAWNLHARLVKY